MLTKTFSLFARPSEHMSHFVADGENPPEKSVKVHWFVQLQQKS